MALDMATFLDSGYPIGSRKVRPVDGADIETQLEHFIPIHVTQPGKPLKTETKWVLSSGKQGRFSFLGIQLYAYIYNIEAPTQNQLVS